MDYSQHQASQLPVNAYRKLESPSSAGSAYRFLYSHQVEGGVLLTATDTSQFAISVGLGTGVSAITSEKMKIVGAIVGTRLVDSGNPIAYGYSEKLSAYCDNGPI